MDNRDGRLCESTVSHGPILLTQEITKNTMDDREGITVGREAKNILEGLKNDAL